MCTLNTLYPSKDVVDRALDATNGWLFYCWLVARVDAQQVFQRSWPTPIV